MGRDAQPGPLLRTRLQVLSSDILLCVRHRKRRPLAKSGAIEVASIWTSPSDGVKLGRQCRRRCCRDQQEQGFWLVVTMRLPQLKSRRNRCRRCLLGVCRYYQEKGFWVIVTARVLNLLALGFTAAFSGFLLLWVDWGALRADCIQQDTCDILEVPPDVNTLC